MLQVVISLELELAEDPESERLPSLGACVCVRDGRNGVNGDAVKLPETKQLLKIGDL